MSSCRGSMQMGPDPVLHGRTDGRVSAAQARPPWYEEGRGAGCGTAGNAAGQGGRQPALSPPGPWGSRQAAPWLVPAPCLQGGLTWGRTGAGVVAIPTDRSCFAHVG